MNDKLLMKILDEIGMGESRFVDADLQNHWSTFSRVLDADKVADTARERLGEGGVVGLVNYDDCRYEAFARQAERVTDSNNLGNGFLFSERDVLVVRGQEVKTESGDLLIFGLEEGVHLKKGMSLEATIKDSHQKGGIVVITTPYFMSKVGEEIETNPDLLREVAAIETHDGGIMSRAANKKAKELYRRFGEKYGLGELASSDGHSFFEVGGSTSMLEMPSGYTGIQEASELRGLLREGISYATARKKTYSPRGFAIHAGLIGSLVAAEKMGLGGIARNTLEFLRIQHKEAKTGNF